MSEKTKPDLSCVPYRRKGLYFALTIPLVGLLVVVFVYLWSVGIGLALIYLGFYLWMCTFQSYCCAYQECPYVGGFCPAVIGIYPGNLLAKWLYGKGMVKSRRRFQVSATLGTGGWVALVAFPLFWLARLGAGYAVGYVAAHAVYGLVYGLTVCPVCAIRGTCPGGSVQRMVWKE